MDKIEKLNKVVELLVNKFNGCDDCPIKENCKYYGNLEEVFCTEDILTWLDYDE
jgi:hypothetical protein